MLKKVLSLLLALIMLSLLITGCSENKEDQGNETADTENSSRIAMTLSLWMPTDDSTTEEAISLVEEALNKISQSKYNTAIELHLIPRSQYQETIDQKLADVKYAVEQKEAAEEARRKALREQKLNGGTTKETEVETEESKEETVINEYGIAVTSYPEIPSTQLDIMFVSGYDRYIDYAYGNYIQPLDTELSGSSKILKSYIYPTYFKAIYDFGTYAVPNNHPAGKAQYLLVNKALVEEYDYYQRELSSLIRCKNFIIDIGNQHLDNVIPLLGPVDAAGMVYWGEYVNEDDFSLICSQLSNESAFDKAAPPESLIENNIYINNLKFIKEIDSYGYMGDGTLEEGQIFAVGVIEADEETIKQYEDEYYISVYSNAVMNEDDIFDSMFAVSQYSKSVPRSMEIITLINTDQTFRTILQYGVEGVHWAYEDPDTKETIKIISDDYKMDLNETGNVFMTYPGEGLPMSYWDQYLEHNIETISDPFMKMPEYVTEENSELYEELLELNKEYKERIDKMTFENFNSELREMRAELAENETLLKLLDPEDEESLIYFYTDWQETTY